MKRTLLFLLFFGLLISPKTYAENVTIKGQNASYAGSILQLKTCTDPFTYNERVLAEVRVDSNGSFILQVDLPVTSLVFLPIGVYKGFLFAEPGKNYEIKLPPRKDKTPAEKLNPYFEEEELLLGIANTDPNELNFQIRKFDDQLDRYINLNFAKIYRKGTQSVGQEYMKELKEAYKESSSPFFNKYLEYRLGFLEYLAFPRSFGQLEDRYFKGRPVLYNNPAYTSLFKKLYGNFLTGYFDRKEGANLKEAFQATNTYDELKQIFSKYEPYQDENLRDLVLLNGLFDGYTHKLYTPKMVLKVMGAIQENATNAYQKQTAANMIARITHLRQGFPAPDFHLTYNSKQYDLKNHHGRYLYLSFANTQNYACQQDFEELRKLHEQFGENIDFLTILTDWDAQQLDSFLRDNQYAWPIVPIGDNQSVVREFEIKAYPTYFLIDPEGNLMRASAPGPKEHIDYEFLKIIRELQRKAYQETQKQKK